jgi:hypothetical protein
LQFDSVKGNLLDLKTIKEAHDLATNEAFGDKDFVYSIIEKLFGSSILETHTLKGIVEYDSDRKKSTVRNQLDRSKLDYGYRLLCARVTAIGLNVEDRANRQKMAIYNNYVRMVAEKHRKVLVRRIAAQKKTSTSDSKEKQPTGSSGTDNNNALEKSTNLNDLHEDNGEESGPKQGAIISSQNIDNRNPADFGGEPSGSGVLATTTLIEGNEDYESPETDDTDN